MQQFSRNGPSPNLRRGTRAEKDRLKKALDEGAMKARLMRSGLWNPDDAMNSSIKVYRRGEEPID